MKRILILNYEYPPVGGGAGVMTRYIAEGLANRNFAITVVTVQFGADAEMEEHGNLKIIRLKAKRAHSFKSNPAEMLDWLFKTRTFLKEYVKDNTFNLALCNFSIPGGAVGFSLNKWFNIPYLIISHGHDIPWFYPQKMLAYHLPLYPIIRAICKRAAGIVSLTNKLKINADNLTGTPDKNIVIPNGINTSLFKPVTNKPAVFTVVFCGRLVDQKDPMTFLKALDLLNKKVQFRAVLVGDGPLNAKAQAFIKANNLSGCVEMVGKVAYQNMPDYFSNAHVYAMTSTHEGMPLTLIEAACSGNYIITTPVSGSDELVFEGKNGSYINYGDYNALAAKLELAAANFSSPGFVDAETVSQIRNSFSTDSIIEKYETAINTFCKGS